MATRHHGIEVLDDRAKHKLTWGWLRLFLGWLQMSLAAVAVGALLTVGLHSVTYALVIAATATTLTSRLLFHCRHEPKLKGTHFDDKPR